MNPSIELSIIRANSASVSPSNTPATIFAMLFGNGIAEQIVQVLKGKAQRAQNRPASLAVARSARDMDPTEQQQAFVIRQRSCRPLTGPAGTQFRRGVLDSQRANSDG